LFKFITATGQIHHIIYVQLLSDSGHYSQIHNPNVPYAINYGWLLALFSAF